VKKTAAVNSNTFTCADDGVSSIPKPADSIQSLPCVCPAPITQQDDDSGNDEEKEGETAFYSAHLAVIQKSKQKKIKMLHPLFHSPNHPFAVARHFPPALYSHLIELFTDSRAWESTVLDFDVTGSPVAKVRAHSLKVKYAFALPSGTEPPSVYLHHPIPHYMYC
jgi:hypothetical protein